MAKSRTGLYLRVSSRRQEKGSSLAEQLRDLTDYAEAHDLEIVEIYKESVSSWQRNARRVEFDRMMTDAKAGRLDVILIWKLDRFARRQGQAHSITEELEALGVHLISVHERIDFTEQGMAPKAMKASLALAAEFESISRSDRSKMANSARTNNGLFTCGRWPTGYKYGGKLKPSKVDTPRAKGVILAFREYATGKYSLHELAEKLNRLGYTLARSKPYTAESVGYILKNPCYAGYLLVNGQRVKSNEPTIVSLDLFERVQRMLQRRACSPRSSTRKFRTHLLNNLLRCSHCGSKMYVQPTRGETYYYCRLTWRAGESCPADGAAPTKMIHQNRFVPQIEDLVNSIVLPRAWRDQVLEILSNGAKQQEIEKKRNRLAAQLERIKDLYVLGDIDRSRYMSERDEVKDMLSRLVAPERDVEGVIQAGEYLNDIPTLWRLATDEDRRQILRTIFKTIWVDRVNQRISGIEVCPEYDLLFQQLPLDWVDGRYRIGVVLDAEILQS